MAALFAFLCVMLILELRTMEKRVQELDDQNDTFRAALDYFEHLYDQDPQEASVWLHDWNHGDDDATNELDQWVESK